MMKWFLHTRLGQWLSLLMTGWCFIRKSDKRFVVTCDANVLPYDGDPTAAPDKGVSNQRKAWKDWVIFQIPGYAFYARYVAIDIYDGRRLVCFNDSRMFRFAIRAGHEPGVIRVLARAGTYESEDGWLKPEFLARWREGEQEWPLVISKNNILFI